MDILCVDQNDINARIAVTQHIPTIFRFAERTIVIWNSSGIPDCCVHTLGDVKEVRRTPVDIITLLRHDSNAHGGKSFNEGVLLRLWLLQEIILSDKIQFVRCRGVSEHEIVHPENESRGDEIGLRPSELLVSLNRLSYFWSVYGQSSAHLDKIHENTINFMSAFLHSGTVVRGTEPERDFPNLIELWFQDSSKRRTSKPRDFILAIMPQYRFYTVPKNAKQMTFGQLFLDCFRQMEVAKQNHEIWELASHFVSPIGLIDLRSGALLATDNIPEPICLGDLVKLFMGSKPVWKYNPRDSFPHVLRKHRVQVIRVPDRIHDVSLAVPLMAQGLIDAGDRWDYASNLASELRDVDVNLRPALKVLSQVAADARRGIHGTEIEKTWKQRLDAPELREIISLSTLVRLTALISCGLGISAFEWSKQNLTQLLVKVHGRPTLALGPTSVARPGSEYEFFLLKATYREVNDCSVLIAIDPTQGSKFGERCLFPQEIKFS